jgi:hypothetical protein
MSLEVLDRHNEALFEFLWCPVCGQEVFTHIPFEGVFCKNCNTEVVLRESRENRGYEEAVLACFNIEMAVNSLSGLPNKFTARIAEFATEFEVEYTVLGAVGDGIDNVEVLRDRVLANVRALSDDQKDTVDEAIDRLVAKQLLECDGDTVRHR